jgi:hypothetical protein
MTKKSPIYDATNPGHYKGIGGLECIDVIEAFDLGFHLGNAVKYIIRAGVKDPTTYREDLRKARWYINRALK